VISNPRPPHWTIVWEFEQIVGQGHGTGLKFTSVLNPGPSYFQLILTSSSMHESGTLFFNFCTLIFAIVADIQ
jgi:hypothetical protein